MVVGAGPAGATAARTLARAGVPVRLLDKAAFPRNKPCGGAITARVLRRFPYLESELHRIATHAIQRLYLEGTSGESTVIESDAPAALMIRRLEFDALLASLAVREGAELVTGVDIVQARDDGDRVTLVARDGRRFAAPIVIAADGVHSVVARRLGLNPGWPAASVALDMMEETPRAALRDLDPSTLWVAYGYRPPGLTAEDAQDAEKKTGKASAFSASSTVGTDAAPEGYAYIFPKRDHVNIGMGYVLSYFREAVHRTPYDLQRGFIDWLRSRGIVAGGSVRGNFTSFLIPVGGPLREPGRGRVLLAGDAGGFVNGLTAEGIYYAMVSGDVTARTVAESNGSIERLAARYRQAVDYEIGMELRDSVMVQRFLFANSRRIAGIINGAHREGAVTRLILDYAIGRRSYREIRWRILARSPRFGGRLVWQRARSVRPRAGRR